MEYVECMLCVGCCMVLWGFVWCFIGVVGYCVCVVGCCGGVWGVVTNS